MIGEHKQRRQTGKTLWNGVKEDMRSFDLSGGDAVVRDQWRMKIKGEATD